MNWLGTRRRAGDSERETSVVRASGAAKRRTGPPPENAGWTIFSYLISGMLVYGLLGWLLATLTHVRLLIPLGALAGLLVAIGGIVYKYGRS
jgi:F0F1-type ATP synthase assembly protein I